MSVRKAIEWVVNDMPEPFKSQVFNPGLHDILATAKSFGCLQVFANKGERIFLTWLCRRHLTQREYERALRAAWTGVEKPSRTFGRNTPMLFKDCVPARMSSKGYAKLPESITVYRGVSGKGKPRGYSWTTDIRVATFFATRFECFGEARLYQATVAKSDVVMFVSDRSEAEVVVVPENVKSMKRIPLGEVERAASKLLKEREHAAMMRSCDRAQKRNAAVSQDGCVDVGKP